MDIIFYIAMIITSPLWMPLALTALAYTVGITIGVFATIFTILAGK